MSHQRWQRSVQLSSLETVSCFRNIPWYIVLRTNLATSIFWKFAIWIQKHGLHFSVSTRKICSLYQVSKLYSFPPTGANSLSYNKRTDHHVFLAVVIQTPQCYPSLQWYPQWMQYTWWTKYAMNIQNCFWSHPKGSWQVKWLTCSCMHCCMHTSHDGIFRNYSTQKSYYIGMRTKQMIQSRVYALQRGNCPDADLLGQWRKSYHDIVTTKTCCVKYNWFPTSQCLQASVTWWVYNKCKNSIKNTVHRLLAKRLS